MMNNAGPGKTSIPTQFMDQKDIPPNIASELERLHDIISNNGGNANKESREWAQSKIDRIHDAFFCVAPVMKGTTSPNKFKDQGTESIDTLCGKQLDATGYIFGCIRIVTPMGNEESDDLYRERILLAVKSTGISSGGI